MRDRVITHPELRGHDTPMRVARGIQNEVPEACAMGLPVVATSAAVEGIDLPGETTRRVADDGAGFASRVLAALRGEAGQAGRPGREMVLGDHGWPGRLAALDALLEGRPRPGSEP